jgi:hypothetical protein
MFKKPKLETLARVAEMAAAVAVVVSVIYLAKQISDNTKLLRTQSHFNALLLGQRPLEFMVANQDLAGVISQCDTSPDRVSAETWERCLNYYFMQFNAWEYFYYEYSDGSIPRQLWNGADGYFKTLTRAKPGYVRFWSEMQGGFDEPFKSYAAQEIPRSSPSRADKRR